MEKNNYVENSFDQQTLAEWLFYLENRHTDAIQLGPTRMRQVAETLDVLKPSATVITVAGTNGKGTTVAALTSIYVSAGYQVGAYTSPHLISFNERIVLNGNAIDDATLCNIFSDIEIARGTTHLTYFETATLAALLHFKRAQVDLIILEVGMGGRLDATNVIDPELAIITTIDFDHEDYLGGTLDKIGFEKAGILRSEKPFIYADFLPPQSIQICASLLNTPTYVNGVDYSYVQNHDQWIWTYQDKHIVLPKTPWHPHALASVLMATVILQNRLPVTDLMIQQGISSIRLSGRQELIQWNAQWPVLFDVSHNAQSVAHLAEFLRQHPEYKKVHAVFSALGDKNIDALVQPMQSLVHQWYPCVLDSKRAASAEMLDSIFSKYGIIVKNINDSPVQAFKDACEVACSGDLIVVYGSFLTVGAVAAMRR